MLTESDQRVNVGGLRKEYVPGALLALDGDCIPDHVGIDVTAEDGFADADQIVEDLRRIHVVSVHRMIAHDWCDLFPFYW